MKTKTSYIYNYNGKVVLNAEPKPHEPTNHLEHPNGWEEIMLKYQVALAEWEKGNMDVENVIKYGNKFWSVTGCRGKQLGSWKITDGQQVEHTGKTVTKIL